MLRSLVLILLLIGGPAFGQGTPKPKATLNTEITQQLPDNTVGTITPSVMRTVLNDLVASWQQYSSVNAQVGTTYTVQASDYGQIVTFNNGAAIAVTLPAASGSFQSFNFFAKNIGAGTATITSGLPSTICGSTTLALAQNTEAWIVSDGTNYQCSFFVSNTVPITYPLAVNKGGTGGSAASGTLLDNITGFASTGFITRNGAGTYGFQSTVNGLTLGNIAQITGKTFLANSTVSPANITALTGDQLAIIACAPVRSVFLTGLNTTYNTPTCNGTLPQYIELEMVGSGGGGAGSGTTPGAAGAGADTCWKASGTACSSPLYVAHGGTAGTNTPASGGTGGTASGCDDNQPGGAAGVATNSTAAYGGIGGISFFGGAGPGGIGVAAGQTAGVAAATNSGSGGGGAGAGATAPNGSGGGAGAYCRVNIITPVSSYVYTINPGGTGATTGTGGAAGGNGAQGKIIATAHWQ